MQFVSSPSSFCLEKPRLSPGVSCDLHTFLLAAGLGGLGCISVYFIWVGTNWPRWIVAPFFAPAGFANLIWGIRPWVTSP
jgi:hypothetical protein